MIPTRYTSLPALLLACFVGAGFISGCRTVYQPNTVNTPLLERQGQFRGTIDIGNLQAAYALNNSVGLMANAFLHNSSGNDQNANNSGLDISGNGLLVEGGAGYFTKEGGDIIFEAYGGLGFGHVGFEEKRKDGTGPTKTFDADAVKMFLQPGIGIAGDIIEIGITPRISIVRYTGIMHENYSEQELIDYNLRDLDGTTWIFIEPALTIRAGYRAVKAQLQIGGSYKLNNSPINATTGIVNAGISILIGS